MKIPSLLLAFCCSLLCSFPAAAQDMGDLWIIVIGPICIAQEPSYADTEWGKLLQESDFFKNQAALDCFRKRQWASKRLCADVMGMKHDLSNAKQIFARHEKEMEGMEEAFAYFQESSSNTIPGVPKVECPKGKQ